MDDRIGRWLSWALAVICCVYLSWLAHTLTVRVPIFARTLSDFKAPLPNTALLVMKLCSGPMIWVAVVVLAIVLLGKEFLVDNTSVKLAVTFFVFLSAHWFADFALDSLFKPLIDVLRAINGDHPA